jgi:hypothetical protein
MLRYVLILLAVLIATKASSARAQSLVGNANYPSEIIGQMTNGLEPHLLINKHGNDWDVDIELVAKTNFEQNTWLKVTNQVGSKLQLWSGDDGMELQSTNPSVLAAMRLPFQTTVSEILHGVHPANTRGLQWWPVAMHEIAVGESYPVAGFRLQNAFGCSPTNNYILQVTTLIYRVETNGATAHLVAFPPIKVGLMASGEVRKEE